MVLTCVYHPVGGNESQGPGQPKSTRGPNIRCRQPVFSGKRLKGKACVSPGGSEPHAQPGLSQDMALADTEVGQGWERS